MFDWVLNTPQNMECDIVYSYTRYILLTLNIELNNNNNNNNNINNNKFHNRLRC